MVIHMAMTTVKNGTPVGNAHLCKNCKWGHWITGYRESDVLVICNYLSPNMKVPFTVYECSEFDDANKPSWDEMQKLAIEVAPTRTSRKTAGFNVRVPLMPISLNEDEDEEEFARVL